MNDDLSALDQYRGRARLFPLPSLVLFPYAVQPLHIFEPRYRQLMEDALADDRLITLALLKPGWEPTYEGRPPVEPVACLGEIVAEQRLPDGRFNLLLRGLGRVRITREIPTDRLYRTAEAELLPDGDEPGPDEAERLRDALRDRVLPRFTGTEAAREQLVALFAGGLDLGPLLDVLGFALPIPVYVKQQLLEETDIAARAEALTALLAPPGGGARRFPPEFSAN